MEEKFVLKKPIKFEDIDYKELKVDFDKLTGQDIIAAEKEAQSLNNALMMMETSKIYQAIIFAKASGISVDAVMKFYAKDFTRATVKAQTFLMEDLEEEE
ncbi:phage tail assembly protein [Vallitalea maricola]|uniref:Uncharacterized protein n=1 Tax=Vallitalea maricola TaxID=3074433 RepID=A0ACB5UP68_9FIRM|nr:hypothetical protein AN2V17_35770 [Vallitalea sp. AN17-2]